MLKLAARPQGWSRRYPLALLAMLLLALWHSQIGNPLPAATQWALLTRAPADFAELQWWHASLPRLAMALLVGAALGFSGSLLQQLTQNRLVSPMTLGASAGAWLGLVCASIWLPALAAEHSEWPALAGAMLAVLLALAIAGVRGIGGLPLVLGGMALNLLLGALASAIVMLHDQYSRNLFLWGAGDLTQNDWHWVLWLLPRLAPMLLLLWLAPRPLTLLRLGASGAQGRGLRLWPSMLLLLLAALWLSSVAIAAVGLIGFIGLLTPNFARLLGARGARDELAFSALLGALLLLATDALAVLASSYSVELVPSGAAAALIGAPALLWFTRRQSAGSGQQNLSLAPAARPLSRRGWGLLLAGLLALVLVSLTLAPGTHGWQLAWPDALIWSFRWPRTLAAVAGGAALALAGVILQRLLRNPLASPDILGLSAGATLALLAATLWLGRPLQQGGAPLAFGGSMLVLGLLLWLGRRQQYAPGMMALVGISLAALLEAVLQFALARGTADSFAILGWLAGSTYRVSGQQALLLAGGALLLAVPVLCGQRALTLLAIGDGVAQGRGLHLARNRLAWLTLVALLTALVTSVLGPVGFLGLLAPHIAAMLGARRVLPQLLLAALLGSVLLLVADWLGRVLIFPLQVPVGILASVLCGGYFILLLLAQRVRRGRA
ncbi:Fe(3+)-hydroxamate ABC transporter permease FhuB [Vogesella oryzae]|uniref:Fe(3+)-hydroxamate ABC transporter permease FhuB n=1 Tax=Vogesella oryzae TaxID=1735285 RepID=UPI001C2E1AE0|nr:Fe(3+)-hydroxamate ABC transporter permease FhuB [Vogesella oryzae]